MQMPENTIITVDNIGSKMCKVDPVLATKMNKVFFTFPQILVNFDDVQKSSPKLAIITVFHPN